MSPAIGLDIGATKTLGVIVDSDGSVLRQVREPTKHGPAGVIRTAELVVSKLGTSARGLPATTIGLGIPGIIDVERGAVKHAVNLGIGGSWFPLRAELQSRLRLPIVVENDVNVATLGAAAALGAMQDLIYLSVGTGLAAGLVLGGRLRRGAFGAAGEVGHVSVNVNGTLCHCGQRGCLETIASGAALDRSWPSSREVSPPAQALFDSAAAGDPRAIEMRDHFAAGVADAIRILCLGVDPMAVVLGGGVLAIGSPLIDAVVSALRAQASPSPFLRSLDLAGRIHVLDGSVPVGAIGAASLGHS